MRFKNILKTENFINLEITFLQRIVLIGSIIHKAAVHNEQTQEHNILGTYVHIVINDCYKFAQNLTATS